MRYCAKHGYKSDLGTGGGLYVDLSRSRPARVSGGYSADHGTGCVIDARGEAVVDLKSGDFRLFGNGVPQKIRSLSYDEQRPLVVGVIEDVSPSQHSYVREHQSYVNDLIPQLLRAGDRAFVVTVSHEVTLIDELVGRSAGVNHVLLPRGGEALGTPCSTVSGRHLCGETALWKSVYDMAHAAEQNLHVLE